MERMKYLLLAVFSAAGTALTRALGGWDGALQLLVLLMAADYLLGVSVALWFHTSPKTAGGRLSSAAGFRGIVKKGAMLLLVLIAAALDRALGVDAARLGVIYFLAGNEGVSILENIGYMGIELPPALQNAFETLYQRGEDAYHGDTDKDSQT